MINLEEEKKKKKGLCVMMVLFLNKYSFHSKVFHKSVKNGDINKLLD